MHAEYIALLEAFGILCLSIKKRKTQSMFWSYVNIEPEEVGQYFNEIYTSKRSPSYSRLLGLPTERELVTFHLSIFPEGATDKPSIDSYRGYAQNMQLIASTYCGENKLSVRAYNKLKHGFPIVEGTGWLHSLSEPDKIAVIVEDPTISKTGRVGLWRLSMDQELATGEIANFYHVTMLGAEIIATCIGLDSIGKLY
jgi:hypothetical protein